MENFDYWRLCDEFSVVHAALLIIGCANPAEFDGIEGWKEQDRPPNFTAAFTALVNAINGEKLLANMRHDAYEQNGYWDNRNTEWEERVDEKHGSIMFRINPNWSTTTIAFEDTKDWLKSRGFTTGFFFPEASTNKGPEYLDSNNDQYAPKLAAAVNAWLAVTSDASPPKDKTPKQRIDIWLRKNADHYGLTKDDGYPNEEGIKEISKVANWKPSGPSKTPE